MMSSTETSRVRRRTLRLGLVLALTTPAFVAWATPLTFTYDPAGRLQTFTLPSGSSVTFAYDLNGNRLHESVTPPPDTTKPTVASANIPDGATGVAVDSPITVTFSEAMNAATFTDQTFQVVGPTGQVAGAISYSGTTATFKPTQSLQYFTNYTVTLTTAVKDPAGNPLAQNYTFGFRTMVAPATGMAGGGGHSVMVLSDGTVWAWGYNSNGQVGDGTTTDRNAPVPVAGLTGMESVASGGTHTLAIRQSDGAVFAWGWNAYGQCGNGTTADQIKPVQVNILTGVGVVAGGLYHSLALLDDGTVWAWGHNGFGQLGDGTTTQRTTPVQVLGQGGIGYLTNIVAIATQGTHSLALRDDGTVWAWGYNGEGQLGDGTVTQRLTPVQVTGLVGVAEISAGLNHSLARLNDGALRAWGANSVGQLGDGSTTKRLVPIAVSGLGPAVDIAAGANFSMAVLNDKTVRAWGYNASAQLGDGTFVNRLTPVPVGGLTGIQGVAAGQSHAFARQANGTLVGWGYNFYGQVGDASATFAAYTPHQVGAFVGAKAIASGGKHALLVDGNGDVYAWGNNSSGQLGDGTTEHHHTPQPIGLTNAKAVAAGTAFSVALMNDSTVRVWGINSSGELGLGAAGGNELLPKPLSDNFSGAETIASGDFTTAALKNDQTVWTWGSDSNGQLGNGTAGNPGKPVQVVTLANVTAIAAGGRHFLALRKDPATNETSVWAWGHNLNGQLGDGTTTDRAAPVQVSGLGDVVAIGAGWRHSLAATADGTVYAWGLNTSGQLGDGTKTNRLTPVPVSAVSGLNYPSHLAGGAGYSLAVRAADGTVWAWGNNSLGQLGDGTAISAGKITPIQTNLLADIIGLDAGSANHSLALKAGGTVWEWGWNQTTQFIDDSNPWVLTPAPILWP